MKYIKKIFLITLYLWSFLTPPAISVELDFSYSKESFPINFFFKTGEWLKVDDLNNDQVVQTLNSYIAYEKREKKHNRRNLLNLAIGRILLKTGQPNKAQKLLEKKITGNFILEDYRLYLLYSAFRKIAENKFKKKQFNSAVTPLKKSIEMLFKIQESFPDSPFIDSLQLEHAETQFILGQAYFKSMSYGRALNAYRISLFRNTDDNLEHEIRVNLALASAYEKIGKIFETVDIYTLLLEHVDKEDVSNSIKSFLLRSKTLLKQKGISAKRLMAWAESRDSEKKLDKINKKQNIWSKNNPSFRYFKESLKHDDLSIIIKNATNILKKYPGLEFTPYVLKEVNRRIKNYLLKNSWNDMLNPLIDLFPGKILSNLAYVLWRNHKPESAAILYRRILQNYPMDTLRCHKSLFFLGRIYEDKFDYVSSLEFYHALLEKYGFGPYSTAALFKIPWILRLQGKLDSAVESFKDVSSFYELRQNEILEDSFSPSGSFETASYYWLVQTLIAQGEMDEANSIRHTLMQKYPFSFYSIITRIELGININSLIDDQYKNTMKRRIEGMGEHNRKRLLRAEHLISVGLMDYGINELSLLTIYNEGEPGFIYYLAWLNYLAGKYNNSIRLTWHLVEASVLKTIDKKTRDLLYPKPFLENVRSEIGNSTLDPFIVLSLMRQESGFDKEIISSANAIGLMQLLPSTAHQIAKSRGEKIPNEDDLKTPRTNIMLGVDYLKRLLKEFGNNPVYALASYNAGEQNVRRWIKLRPGLSLMEFVESIPYIETRGYVKNVLRNYYLYSAFYNNRSLKTDELFDIWVND